MTSAGCLQGSKILRSRQSMPRGQRSDKTAKPTTRVRTWKQLERRLDVVLPDAYRDWAEHPSRFVAAEQGTWPLALDDVYWISGELKPAEDDLLVIAVKGRARLGFRPVTATTTGSPIRLRPIVYQVRNEREGSRPRKLYESFAEAMRSVTPTRELRASFDDAYRRRKAWEKWAAILAEDHAGAGVSEEERATAMSELPELFRAASVIAGLGDRFAFLRTPDMLVSAGMALHLEHDRARLLDRLMGVFGRTDQFESEAERTELLGLLVERLYPL